MLLLPVAASAFIPRVQLFRPLALTHPHQAAAPCLPTSAVHTGLQARGSDAVATIGRPHPLTSPAALTALVACRLPLAVMAAVAMIVAAATRLGRRRPFNGLQTRFQASASTARSSLDQEAAGGARSELQTSEAPSPQGVSQFQRGGGGGEQLGQHGGSDGDVALDPLGLRDLAGPRSRLLLVKCCALSLDPAATELALPRLCVRALPSTVEVSQLEQIFAQVRQA